MAVYNNKTGRYDWHPFLLIYCLLLRALNFTHLLLTKILARKRSAILACKRSVALFSSFFLPIVGSISNMSHLKNLMALNGFSWFQWFIKLNNKNYLITLLVFIM